MSSDQCRFSGASAHSVSFEARESKMMKQDVTGVDESTRCFTDGRESVFSQVCFTYGRKTVTDQLSVCEEPMESMTVNSHHAPRDSVCSTALPRRKKSFLSTEEMYALQTCTNTLQFKTNFGQEEGGRPRSASFSLPSTTSSTHGEHVNENLMTESTVLWKFNFGRRGGMFPRTHKMPLQQYRALEEEERRWNFSKTDRVVRTEEVPEELRTTVMMRGIPAEYTRDDILHLLQSHDFGEINFLYLLMNLNTGLNAGYCFINFRFPHEAMEFKSAFTGADVFRSAGGSGTTTTTTTEDGERGQPCTAQVQWRSPIQGFASHVDRLKNSYYLTQANYPSQFKPTVIRHGKEVKFPEVWGKVYRIQKIQRYMMRKEKALNKIPNTRAN